MCHSQSSLERLPKDLLQQEEKWTQRYARQYEQRNRAQNREKCIGRLTVDCTFGPEVTWRCIDKEEMLKYEPKQRSNSPALIRKKLVCPRFSLFSHSAEEEWVTCIYWLPYTAVLFQERFRLANLQLFLVYPSFSDPGTS